jgi:hypothetical protein
MELYFPAAKRVFLLLLTRDFLPLLARVSLLPLTIATAVSLPSLARAQSDKDTETSTLVNSQHYTFYANNAMPMGGRNHILTSSYDMEVKKDLINCYLPYYGRSYTAPADPTQGPLNFTSKDFTYSITAAKKGGWDIALKPTDKEDIQTMNLHISSSGNASLQVTFLSRTAITFSGYIGKPAASH